MKKVVVVLMILMTATSFAQKGEKKGKMKDMSPEQVATLQTKKATLALDLTERQQEQIKALLLEKAEIRKSKMAAQKGRKDDLGESVSVDERFARESERLDYQIAQKEQLQKILSPEQMEKWEAIQRRRGHRGKAKGRKRSKR